MVVSNITGVLKLKPVPSTVPPDAVLYQSIVSPALTLADIVTAPVPHLEPLTGLTGAPGAGFIMAVTAILVADTHPVDVFFVSA